MACESSAFRTIVNAPDLQDVVKRQPLGYSLGADPQRSRSEDVDVAVAEARTRANIVNLGRAPSVLEDAGRAIVRAMLETRQGRKVDNALTNGRVRSWSAADFPQAGLGLRKC